MTSVIILIHFLTCTSENCIVSAVFTHSLLPPQDEGALVQDDDEEEEEEEEEEELGVHPDAETTHIFVGKEGTGRHMYRCTCTLCCMYCRVHSCIWNTF